MKSPKSIIALIAMSLATAGFVFAAEGKTENKPGKCCAAAAKDGKTCTHECCVAAAKEGNNCAKCGGSGKIQAKKKKSESK